MSALLSHSHPLIFGVGPTGTGKTHLAVAAGLSQVAEQRFKTLIITRPRVMLEGEVMTASLRAETAYDEQLTPIEDVLHDLIGPDEFRVMKPNAVILNVGRGPVINEAALVKALTEKTIRGAALDVFDVEPLPEGHPIYKLDNVLLSPHCADRVDGWLEMAMEVFLDNFERFTTGNELINVVDKKSGY